MRAGTRIGGVALIWTLLLLGELNAWNMEIQHKEKENEDLMNLISELAKGNTNLDGLDLSNLMKKSQFYSANEPKKFNNDVANDTSDEETPTPIDSSATKTEPAATRTEPAATRTEPTPSGTTLGLTEPTSSTKEKPAETTPPSETSPPSQSTSEQSEITTPKAVASTEQPSEITTTKEKDATTTVTPPSQTSLTSTSEPLATRDNTLSTMEQPLSTNKGISTPREEPDTTIEQNLTTKEQTLTTTATPKYECQADDCGGDPTVATCIEFESTFNCNCTDPNKYFDYNKKTCEGFSECIQPGGCNQLKNNSVCNVMTQKCECPCGFKDNTNGCEKIERPDNAAKEAACVLKNCDAKKNPIFECTCPLGFKLSTDQKKCLLVSCELKSVHKCTQGCELDEYKEKGFKCVCLFDSKEVGSGEPCPTNTTFDCGRCGKGGICNGEEENSNCICKTNFVRIEGKGDCTDKCTANKYNDTFCKKCKANDDQDYGYECEECAEGYKKLEGSKTTCIPKDPCKEVINGVKGDEECGEVNKLCESAIDNKKFTCKGCKPGFEESNVDSTRCIDTCEVEKCGNKKAYCVKDKQGKATCPCPALRYPGLSGVCELAPSVYVLELPGLNMDATTTYEASSVSMYSFESVFYAIADNLPKATADIILNALKIADNKVTAIRIIETKTNGDTTLEVVFGEKMEPYAVKQIFQKLDCTLIDQKVDTDTCVVPPFLVVKNREVFRAALKVAAPENAANEPCKQIKPCIGEGLLCVPLENDYKCECSKDEGYQKETTDNSKSIAIKCGDLDECATGAEICKNAQCLNLSPKQGKYFCKCNEKHKNKENTTEDCIAVCSGVNCQNGGSCAPHDSNSYACSCAKGYVGTFCATKVDDPEASKAKMSTAETNVIIVGVVLAAILLLTIIVSAVIIRKLRGKLNKSGGNNQAMDEFNSGRRGYDNPAGPR